MTKEERDQRRAYIAEHPMFYCNKCRQFTATGGAQHAGCNYLAANCYANEIVLLDDAEAADALLAEKDARVAALTLLFLGQHLWTVHIECPGSKATACICSACDAARKAYQDATGAWPTSEQENEAMRKWGTGSRFSTPEAQRAAIGAKP